MFICPICERRHDGVTLTEGSTSAVCLECHKGMRKSGELAHAFHAPDVHAPRKTPERHLQSTGKGR